MSEARQTVTSLYRLTQFPVDFHEDIFTFYPALKLGLRESTVYYARRLMPLAEALIASNPQHADWVLTAPPYHAIPAAANLLCAELFELLQAGLPTTANTSFVKISEKTEHFGGDKVPDDYSRLSWPERSEARERSATSLLHREGLSGRAVIFVNDINVTGAQQRIMQRYFEEAGVAIVHWLYIIDVEESLGKRMPHIEYEINNSRIASFEEFANAIATKDVNFTAKCMARIFAYDIVDLKRLFGMLPLQRRAMILQLVLKEARYGGDYFKEKIDLLTAFCSLDLQPG
ncbi:MAG TPA: phosphoribosyltransferase family protein [Sinorhizobium sp.]|nr:phosphoribosyltransferase family protein [Sinorhizobium sp.]